MDTETEIFHAGTRVLVHCEEPGTVQSWSSTFQAYQVKLDNGETILVDEENLVDAIGILS